MPRCWCINDGITLALLTTVPVLCLLLRCFPRYWAGLQGLAGLAILRFLDIGCTQDRRLLDGLVVEVRGVVARA